MESAILSEYIQNIVDDVVHHNEPFDDTKKKWLKNYGELENLEEKEIETIINNLEVFFEALDELKTRESRHIETMAKRVGRYCHLSESQLDEYILTARTTREEEIARMETEIQDNIDSIKEAKRLCQKETDTLAGLKSDIAQLQDTKAKTILLAEKKALEPIEPQWNQAKEALRASKKKCEDIRKQISKTKDATEDWKNKTEQQRKKANAAINRRKMIIHNILLLGLAVIITWAEFLLLEEKGMAWVLCIFNVAFAGFRLGSIDDNSFEKSPEFLFTFIPLLSINGGAFLIDSEFYHIWAIALGVLIPTALVFWGSIDMLHNDINDKPKVTHHFVLISIALLISLFEFFTFGRDGIELFDYRYGWGWAIVPFICNASVVIRRVLVVARYDKGKKWQKKEIIFEYLYSMLPLAVINGFAIWFHNGWVLALLLLYPALEVVSTKIYASNH